MDASLAGDDIIVTDGVYQTIGSVSNDGATNCVLASDAITIQSVNGAAVTTINGSHFARCAYLTNGSVLSGFTLANGHAFQGGGVFCVSSNVVISNCIVISNLAVQGAGGYSGTYYNCTFTGNIATNSTLPVGGGCYSAQLNGCSFYNNSAGYAGGGAVFSTLTNCWLSGNFSFQGGGAANSTLYDCTVSNNQALPARTLGMRSPYPGIGGGVFDCFVQNCLIISNSAPATGPLPSEGGGAGYSTAQAGITMDHCTLVGNWAAFGGGFAGPGNPNATPPLLTNCVMSGNWAGTGGGVYYANLMNCTLNGNWATNDGGAANSSSLFNCTLTGNSATNYGGGAFECRLSNCLVSGNSALQYGGGASGSFSSGATELNGCILQFNSAPIGGGVYDGFLNDCLVISNSAASVGGGGEYAEMGNCTVVGNSSSGIGGGDSGQDLYNSIVYNNSAAAGGANTTNCYLTYCCTTPDSASDGPNNITNAPQFVNYAAGNFQLQLNSPCINSGNNADVNIYSVPDAFDLAANPRIVGGTVDIGAYEYQSPTSVISYAYLQQYGLPTDGSVDFTNLNGTAFDVYQDWIAGLNPTNSASVLAMLTPVTTNTTSGVTVTWQSVSGIPYFLQRSTNLATQPPFSTIQNNITGQTNTTSYTDASATNGIPYFYRVGVVAP